LAGEVGRGLPRRNMGAGAMGGLSALASAVHPATEFCRSNPKQIQSTNVNKLESPAVLTFEI